MGKKRLLSKSSKYLTKKENIEIRIYELLGVKIFRKCAFALEKLIHIKDKGINKNYHISNDNSMNPDEFNKFLYYNGAIHVKNSMILPLMIVLNVLISGVSLATLGLVLLLIKDLNCVMLQRYNYLRIKSSSSMKEAINKKRIEKKVFDLENNDKVNDKLNSLSMDETKSLLELGQNMESFLKNESDIILNNEKLNELNNLKEMMFCLREETSKISEYLNSDKKENNNVLQIGGN